MVENRWKGQVERLKGRPPRQESAVQDHASLKEPFTSPSLSLSLSISVYTVLYLSLLETEGRADCPGACVLQ